MPPCARGQRRRRTLRSRIEEIPGVGKTTARKLRAHFRSVVNLQRVGAERIAQVVLRDRAETVFRHLHEGDEAQRRISETTTSGG